MQIDYRDKIIQYFIMRALRKYGTMKYDEEMERMVKAMEISQNITR